MDQIEKLQAAVDRLMANVAVQGASIEALLFLCRDLAQKGGIAEIDGLPIDAWFQQQKLLQLEEALLSIEDHDSGYAALLQSIIDESRKRRDGEGPQ